MDSCLAPLQDGRGMQVEVQEVQEDLLRRCKRWSRTFLVGEGAGGGVSW